MLIMKKKSTYKIFSCRLSEECSINLRKLKLAASIIYGIDYTMDDLMSLMVSKTLEADPSVRTEYEHIVEVETNFKNKR